VREEHLVAIAPKSKDLDIVKAAISGFQREVPGWLQVDKKKLEAVVVERPAGESIDVPIRDEMIVELYSR
jgi:small subunit ribosomal protein S4